MSSYFVLAFLAKCTCTNAQTSQTDGSRYDDICRNSGQHHSDDA